MMRNALDNVLAVVLGGGVDSWLYPLTKTRSKPAVSLYGKYRLIDIPLSNCINSGIYHVAVMTQFNSVSLHRHISDTYNFDFFHHGWVQIWAADQTNTTCEWYLGTADAVRKKLSRVLQTNSEYVLVLGADHLYRMDYGAMLDFHIDTNADVTVAAKTVSREDTARFGILKTSVDRRITHFIEKPTDSLQLSQLVSYPDQEKPYIGSMGIYLFSTKALVELIEYNNDRDFARDILPRAIHTHNMYTYDFQSYWEDLGTIRAYYDTNLKLTKGVRSFDFYNPEAPIYTSQRYLPGSVVEKSHLEEVLLTEGCIIEQATIRHSVIGLRSRIRSGAEIIDSLILGADYFWANEGNDPNELNFGIGENCYIEGAIVDTNVRMGANCIVKPFPRGTNFDTENWVVRDGIVIFPKDVSIPPGTVITPERYTPPYPMP
jgi:glucose-1-phosphate adenylyltransferase